MEQVTSPEREALRRRVLQEQEDVRIRFLQEAFDDVADSNCLDRKLAAFLVKDGHIIGRGPNLCAPPPHKYGEKLEFCPRLNAKRGTNRKKCRGFHAEIFACLSATQRGISPKDYSRFAWHQFDGEVKRDKTRLVLQRRFTTADRERLRGAELYLVGIAYVCKACQWLLDELGVGVHKENVVRYRPITPDQMARRIESAKP